MKRTISGPKNILAMLRDGYRMFWHPNGLPYIIGPGHRANTNIATSRALLEDGKLVLGPDNEILLADTPQTHQDPI